METIALNFDPYAKLIKESLPIKTKDMQSTHPSYWNAFKYLSFKPIPENVQGIAINDYIQLDSLSGAQTAHTKPRLNPISNTTRTLPETILKTISDVSETYPLFSGFSKQEIQQQSLYSEIAYNHLNVSELEHSAQLNQNLVDTGIDTKFFHHNNHTAGVIFSQGTQVTITYKGTDTLRDMLVDFTPNQIDNKFSTGKVHGSFYYMFNETWNDVYHELKQISQKTGTPIDKLEYTISGHSLGGALAVLAGFRLAEKTHPENIKVITFGCPRVLDAAGAHRYNQLLGTRTLRVAESYIDPVPKLCIEQLGYEHVGQPLSVYMPFGYIPHTIKGYEAAIEHLQTLPQKPQPTYNMYNRYFTHYTNITQKILPMQSLLLSQLVRNRLSPLCLISNQVQHSIFSQQILSGTNTFIENSQVPMAT